MALCWRQKTRVFGEPLDRRLSPFWPGPLLDPGSPRHTGVGWIDPAWVAASTVLPLFLPSLILIGLGFPCSGSQSSRTSSTANVSQFVQDHVGGDDPLGSSGRNPWTRLGLPHRPSYGSSNAEKPKALVLEIRTGPWEAQVERGPVSSWGEGMSCSHPPLGSQTRTQSGLKEALRSGLPGSCAAGRTQPPSPGRSRHGLHRFPMGPESPDVAAAPAGHANAHAPRARHQARRLSRGSRHSDSHCCLGTGPSGLAELEPSLAVRRRWAMAPSSPGDRPLGPQTLGVGQGRTRLKKRPAYLQGCTA
nr:uncharacterized protein LOC129019590 [Pongo pygmaeus]XP_054318473.1 uncharacterized protein LOC129019590 [Pongo pygmaeus]XP_054318474.1 uncharacterized protein LOC129019590 [Pongo pygmaeus]